MSSVFDSTGLSFLDISGWDNHSVQKSNRMFFGSNLEEITIGDSFTFEKNLIGALQLLQVPILVIFTMMNGII